MSAPKWPTPEQAAAAAAAQEAATLAGIEETAAARGIAVPSPATGVPSSPPAPSPTEAVRDHSLLLQRAKLISEGGMTKAEADAWYAEMTGQPVPVVVPAAVPAATGKDESASRESFPVVFDVTPIAMTEEEMNAALRRLRDAKAKRSAAEDAWLRAGLAHTAAIDEWISARDAVAAGVAALTEEP